MNALAKKTTVDTDEQRITALAGALYVATAAYAEALKMPSPAATLDDMCDALPEFAPKMLRTLKATPEMATVVMDAVTDRLWAFTAVEYARTEAGDGYGYVFDLLADGLREGADPHVIRTTALDAPRRIRELAEAAR